MVRRRAYQGVTLVEMIVTIVILAIALVSLSSMLGLGASNSADTLLETRAIALGESYLDEIKGRRFDENSAASGLAPCYGFIGPSGCSGSLAAVAGPEGGETTRDRFDDVDDYHGLIEGDGAINPITDAEGNERTGYENFNVAISVRYAGHDAVLGLDPTNAKLITVTVTTRNQTTGWKFSLYKGNY